MRLFYTTGQSGHYISAYAIVLATDEQQARELLDQAIVDDGLLPDYELAEVDMTQPQALILFNGDY